MSGDDDRLPLVGVLTIYTTIMIVVLAMAVRALVT